MKESPVIYKTLYKQLEPEDFELIRVWSDEALKRYFGDEWYEL